MGATFTVKKTLMPTSAEGEKMYNDRIDRSRNSYTPPRVPFGRSCPAMAVSDEAPTDRPQLDERRGNRNCDGSPRTNTNDKNPLGWGLADHPLAMVYSPYQLYRDVYEPDTALKRGTLFGELDLPFEGDKKRMGGLC